MKKLIILTMVFLMLFSVLEGKKLQDYSAIGSGVAVDADLLRIEDMSASAGTRTKKILMSSLITYIYGANRTMSGTLSMGANALSGSSVSFTGGTLNGISMGAISPMTYLKLDNLLFNGQTISTFGSNDDIIITPNGTGKVDINSDLEMSSKDITSAADIGCANITATNTVTAVNGVFTGSGSIATNLYLNCTPQSLIGTGTILAAVARTNLTTGAGAATITMTDGNTNGQLHYIVVALYGGGDATLSGGKLGFTSIVFANKGDSVTMLWDSTEDKWFCVGTGNPNMVYTP